MIIRDAAEGEQPYIRELRLNAYKEHAQKIPRGSLECSKNVDPI